MSDYDGVGLRLKELRKKSKMTQSQLAEKVGLTNSAISKFEAGTSAPSWGTAKKIAALHNVSVEYILSGIVMTSQDYAQYSPSYNSTTNTSNASRISVDKLNLRVLPYLPIEARAGLAEFYADDISKYPWENADTLAVLDVPDTSEYKEAIVVAINGDSMEPTIKNGSKVVVTPVQRGNWQYINSGVYCIVYNNNFVVKRVKDNTLLETGLLRLYSDNPAGGSFPVKGEDIKAVWRVRWAAYTPID